MSDKNSSDSVNRSDTWRTITEACHILGISRRTVERRIKQGEIESELRDGIRYVKLNIDAGMSQELTRRLSQLEADNERLMQEVGELKADKRKLEAKLEEKDEALRRKDEQMAEAGHRHDTVVMQMTRLVEYHQQPFWRRWRKRKQLPEATIIDEER